MIDTLAALDADTVSLLLTGAVTIGGMILAVVVYAVANILLDRDWPRW